MPSRSITLAYRKVIDSASAKPWEKLVFEDSYREFRMQAQYFNQEKKYRSFAELVQHVPGAERLHFLVSAAVTGYIQQLDGQVPDIASNLGKLFLSFEKFQFEIINSDMQDKTKHQVAITFYSMPLAWHETIGNYLLVSDGKTAEGEQLTHLLPVQPYLSIHSLHIQ